MTWNISQLNYSNFERYETYISLGYEVALFRKYYATHERRKRHTISTLVDDIEYMN